MGAMARSFLISPLIAPVWRPFLRGRALVLMLHRFEDPDLGVEGHDPKLLAQNLEYLRRHRYHLSSLPDLIRRLEGGDAPLPRTVVFTVDDGYSDFSRVAAPVFEKFDCAPTSFLVTGFVDGTCWLWYDALRYLLGDERTGSIQIEVGEATVRLRWSSNAERRDVVDRVTRALKQMPSRLVTRTLEQLVVRLGVTLPPMPTAAYSAMTWDEVRRWSERGVHFGPHTHTHQILSRAGEDEAANEIRQSWNRLRSEVRDALPVFCYPNGMRPDFGPRDEALVAAAGLVAAFRASGGPCGLRAYRSNPFELPRVAYNEDPALFRQVACGLDSAIALARGLFRP